MCLCWFNSSSSAQLLILFSSSSALLCHLITIFHHRWYIYSVGGVASLSTSDDEADGFSNCADGAVSASLLSGGGELGNITPSSARSSSTKISGGGCDVEWREKRNWSVWLLMKEHIIYLGSYIGQSWALSSMLTTHLRVSGYDHGASNYGCRYWSYWECCLRTELPLRTKLHLPLIHCHYDTP